MLNFMKEIIYKEGDIRNCNCIDLDCDTCPFNGFEDCRHLSKNQCLNIAMGYVDRYKKNTQEEEEISTLESMLDYKEENIVNDENNEEKEICKMDNNMFGNFDMFGVKVDESVKSKLAISFDGKIAYKKEDGSYITVSENGEITNILNCIIPNSSKMIMVMPTNSIGYQDLIIEGDKIYSVLNLEDNKLECIDLETKQIVQSIKENNQFGMNFYMKAMSFFNPTMMTGEEGENPMQQMMMMSMMSGGDNSNIMQMMMMANMMKK